MNAFFIPLPLVRHLGVMEAFFLCYLICKIDSPPAYNNVISVEEVSILPTRRGIVGDERSGGTEMEPGVLADESRVAEQPYEQARALEARPSIGDDAGLGRALEEHRAHQQRRIRRDFARTDEFNLKPRGLLG